jgi:hypothetical protein
MKASDELSAKATEMMKKVLTVGVGAFFLTEEGLRGLVSDFKLPKELLTTLLSSAQKTRNEFLSTLSREIVGPVMEKMRPDEFVQNILENNDIEFKIRMSFKPKQSPKNKDE